MLHYIAKNEARHKQIVANFDLYNDRRFAELAELYSDDIVCVLPIDLVGLTPDLRFSRGKVQYFEDMVAFRNIYGRLTVNGVFAVGPHVSVLLLDELGNDGTFDAELRSDGKIARVFYHHNRLRTDIHSLRDRALVQRPQNRTFRI